MQHERRAASDSQPRTFSCLGALLLTAMLTGCGTAQDGGSPNVETKQATDALTIPASEEAQRSFSIDAWVMSGEGDARQVDALDATGESVAFVDLRPEHQKEGARLDVTLTMDGLTEHLKLASDGTISGDASTHAVELIRALYKDLQAWGGPTAGTVGANEPSVEANASGVRSTSQALTYACGSVIGRGDSVRCGTVFLGESRICLTNHSPTTGAAYIDYFGTTYGVRPYGVTCLIRWYWGADVYTYNTSGASILVSH